MVGIGALRTDHAERLVRDAEAEGAEGLLMTPMSYTPLTQDEVFEHFKAVAGVPPPLPMCIYNNPSTTHFSFGAPLLDRIAALPDVVAIKMPLPKGEFDGELAELRAAPRGSLAIGYYGDRGMAGALSSGADAFYSVLAGFLASEAKRLPDAVLAGRQGEADKMQQVLRPLLQLLAELGGLRVAYTAASHLELCEAQPPLPILPVSDDDRRRITSAVNSARM